MKKILLIVAFFALAAMTFYFSACVPWGGGSTGYTSSQSGTGGWGGMMGGGGGMMGQGMMGGGGMMSGQSLPISFLPNGERIYYTGISASGRPIGKYGGPMWLNMRGGGCVSCHGEDGRGGAPVLMGSAIPPDISYFALTDAHQGPGNGHSHQPYSEELIKRAIVKGINAEGKPLNATMPRWQMSDGDLKDLIEYLKGFPRPELAVSGAGPQGFDGHALDDGHPISASTGTSHDSAAPKSAEDDHSLPATAGTSHDTAASILSDGDQSHSTPAGASVGRPSYTLLVSVLAVVAVTFGTVFYLKRKEAPASLAGQSPPGPKG
ncbi:MAG: cytochrome c [Dehalococcoidia bacterium]|nr:cytochrome c [Dehalococcoidia bacterium]